MIDSDQETYLTIVRRHLKYLDAVHVGLRTTSENRRPAFNRRCCSVT